MREPRTAFQTPNRARKEKKIKNKRSKENASYGGGQKQCYGVVHWLIEHGVEEPSIKGPWDERKGSRLVEGVGKKV